MNKLIISFMSVLFISTSLFGQGGLLIADLDTDSLNADAWLNIWGSGGKFIERQVTDDTPDGSETAIQIDIDFSAGTWGAAWGPFPGTNIGPEGEKSLDASGYNYFSCYLKSTVALASLDVWFEHFPGTGTISPDGYVNMVTITDIWDEWEYYEVPIDSMDMNFIRDGWHDMTAINRMSFGGPVDLGEPYSILIDQLRFINEPDEGMITSVKEKGALEPVQFSLQQNYPNPFNPSTQIFYSLPTSGQVKLKVYDLLGQQIEVLVDEVQNAGYHTTVFSANNLSSGVYFYRLQAGDQVSFGRMVLMR